MRERTLAKRSRPEEPRYDEFVFWVRRPSTSYSLSLQLDGRQDDPYRELLSFVCRIECLAPARFEGRDGEAMFFADDDLAAGGARRRWPDEPIEAVGGLQATKSQLQVSGFLPAQVCWSLSQAMAAGTITSLGAMAFWTKRGHAYLKSLAFRGPEFDPIAYLE